MTASAAAAADAEGDLIVRREGSAGIIRLNRPKALNAMTLAMAIELEGTAIKVTGAAPGFTKTNLNNYAGTQTVEEGAEIIVRMASIGPDGPTGGYFSAAGPVPW